MKKILFFTAFGVLLHASSITLPERFEADFTQKITTPDKKVAEYSGTVRFSDKKMLKWVYDKPSKKEVCTNGDNLTVVDHDLEQVSYYMTEGFNLSSIIGSAKPYKETKTVFIATFGGKHVTLQIDGNNRLSRVAYLDDLDNEVLIVFENMRYEAGNFEPESMLCRAPDTYDVIEE